MIKPLPRTRLRNMKEQIVTLDVREAIQQGQPPFSIIMDAVRGLKPTEQLQLIAPFEPVPLFKVMAELGFGHQCRELNDGDYEVIFSRPEGEDSGGGEPEVVEVDARGLEPPQPMVLILEAVSLITPEVNLQARTDCRPMHLYAKLEERGFTGESEEQADGSYITYIRRRQPQRPPCCEC
jgi:uncharacterized protein (DUF2249 family)